MLKIRLIIIFAMSAVIGVILSVMSIKDIAELKKPKGELESMGPDDFYSGRFVEGTIYELWDNFGSMTQSDTFLGISYNTKTTAEYYMLPIESTFYEDELIFVALSVSDSSDIRTANKMVEETDDWYYYGEEPALGWTEMHISGKVSKLKGEALDGFEEFVDYYGYSMLPYVISVGNTGGGAIGGLVGAIVFFVIGAGGLAFFIIRKVLSGHF